MGFSLLWVILLHLGSLQDRNMAEGYMVGKLASLVTARKEKVTRVENRGGGARRPSEATSGFPTIFHEWIQ